MGNPSLNFPCKFSIKRRLLHDMSKFSKEEFFVYAEHFFGDREKVRDKISDAFKHHYRHNKHHWQYWNELGVDMPETYIKEMIADWMEDGGAKLKFTDYLNVILGPLYSEDHVELKEFSDKIKMTRYSRFVLSDLLMMLGYFRINGKIKYSPGYEQVGFTRLMGAYCP